MLFLELGMLEFQRVVLREQRQVVVVGDWLNDVPMFRAAGRSFCMGQASPAVSAAATDRLDATRSTWGP